MNRMNKLLAGALAGTILLLTGCGASPTQPQAGNENTKPESRQTEVAGVQSLSLYPAAMELPVGRMLTLKAEVQPADAALTWRSGDSAVLAVDAGGTLTAKASGETTITVSAGEKTAVCAVRVTEDGAALLYPGGLPEKADGSTERTPTGEDTPTGEVSPGTLDPETLPIQIPDGFKDMTEFPKDGAYNWMILVNDHYKTDIRADGIWLELYMAFEVEAAKLGGGDPAGTYVGTFKGEGDYDRENFMAVMNQKFAAEGGRVVDYQENDENPTVAFTATLLPVDGGLAPEQQTLRGKPVAYYATGEVSSSMNVNAVITVEVDGYTMSAPIQYTGESNLAGLTFLLRVDTDGRVEIRFPEAESYVHAAWTEGFLVRVPAWE